MKPSDSYEIWKDFGFAAAHRLPNLPETHRCSRMHGHNYKVRVRLLGPIDPTLGWVEDFGMLEVRVGRLLEQIDHRTLNEIPGLENPTAEVICRWLFERIALCEPHLHSVEVKEEDDCGAIIRRQLYGDNC